jgi:putative lysine transport system permease protein
MNRTFLEWIIYILEHYGDWFLKGTLVTLLIALLGTVVGFLIGLGLGSVKNIPPSRSKLKRFLMSIVNAVITCYVEIFRGTPMMVQAIVLYFGMQEFMGINFSPTVAGIIIVSINTGAYMVEVVRGGIESVDPGQMEGAKSIGMTHGQAMIHVILPQTIRNILPATGNEFIINIKDTSVLNVISVTELFFVTKSIKGAIFRTYETFIVAAAIYLVLTLTVTRILKMLEKRMDGSTEFVQSSSTALNPVVNKTGDA